MSKENNTLLTKAILRVEKVDDLVLLNHTQSLHFCVHQLYIAYTKYKLQITGPSGGKIISFNDE